MVEINVVKVYLFYGNVWCARKSHVVVYSAGHISCSSPPASEYELGSQTVSPASNLNESTPTSERRESRRD